MQLLQLFVVYFSGNVVGYSVISPCKLCLQSCNNGHFYMFHSWAVDVSDRFNTLGENLVMMMNLFGYTYKIYNSGYSIITEMINKQCNAGDPLETWEAYIEDHLLC